MSKRNEPKAIYRFCTKILIKQILCVERKLSVKAEKFWFARSGTSFSPILLLVGSWHEELRSGPVSALEPVPEYPIQFNFCTISCAQNTRKLAQ